MKSFQYWVFSVPFFSFLLGACSTLNPHHINTPYCNELNSRIVLNATTTNTRRADMQRAEQPLQQNNYDRNCLQQ
jgi:hypothetical protein